MVAVAGASGGTKIITAVAQVLFRAFYLGQVGKKVTKYQNISKYYQILNNLLKISLVADNKRGG